MQRLIRKFLWMVLLAAGLQTSWAFSLLGPVNNGGDNWQVTLNGYNPLGRSSAVPYFVDPLLAGPKNLGEEYRRNTPVMYYACNANFLDYFGSNGVVAVDQAFDILNSALTNVDTYSSSLSEFPLNSESENYQAFALGLLDVKSVTLAMMTEQLGLADAVRYTWALHNRFLPAGATCTPPGPGNGVEYVVIQRNYDITASPLNRVQYSPYVNGELYTYSIIENCGRANASPPDADAFEVPTDPLFFNPPVASGMGEDSLPYGFFYSGLTRDDVAGLRYLLTTNNVNRENPAQGSLLESTNNPTILVTTSDLGALIASAQTNDPALLPALFPGVVVASSTSYFTNILVPNVIIYTTNYVGEPFGTPPHIIIKTNGFTISTVQRFLTTFANVVTNSFRTNSTATLLTVTFGSQVGAPVGSPFVTTTKAKTIILTNTPTGDFYIIPADSCGLNIVHVWQTNVIYTTNLIAFAINPDGSLVTQSLVTYYTNHVLEVRPCTFLATATGLYQGIQSMRFIRADFDSLLGQFFQPITNTYPVGFVTNSQAFRQFFQRVVTAPDFVFSAADLSSGPAAELFIPATSRNVNFDQGNILPGLAGPGVINPPTTITYDKVGPNYLNVSPAYLNGHFNPNNTPYLGFIWGSFDGTTNDPIVYPNGTSIENLEAEVLVQISITPTNGVDNTLVPPSVAGGTNGVAYGPVTFSAAGGAFTPPYLWSATGLPAGLTVTNSTAVLNGGTLSGTPTQTGTFDFIIQLTDTLSRTVQWNYSITIN